jgi:hypothetical protein
MYGTVEITGKNPGDWYEVDNPTDYIPTESTTRFADGLVLSFPNGKADVNDLTPRGRQRLEGFVTNKARNIGVLLERSFSFSAARL